MNETKAMRWAAASGYAVLLLGVLGVAFERGAPVFGAPGGEVVAFFARYRTELLAQSVLFVLAAGFNVWFLAGLRSYLLHAEGGAGTLSATAFAAGVIGVAVGTLIHAPQIALATRAGGDMTPDLAEMVSDLGFVCRSSPSYRRR